MGFNVKGLIEGSENDFHSVIQHMYKVEYNSSTSKKKIVLSYYDWFDPSRRGTRVDLIWCCGYSNG